MVYSEHRFLANLKSCPVPHGSLLSTDNSCSPLKNESLGNANNNGYLPVYLIASFVICFSSDTGYSSVPHSIEEIQPLSLTNEVKKVKRRRILERKKEILPQEVNLQPATLEGLLLLSYRRMQLLLQHQSILLLALLQQASIARDLP